MRNKTEKLEKLAAKKREKLEKLAAPISSPELIVNKQSTGINLNDTSLSKEDPLDLSPSSTLVESKRYFQSITVYSPTPQEAANHQKRIKFSPDDDNDNDNDNDNNNDDAVSTVTARGTPAISSITTPSAIVKTFSAAGALAPAPVTVSNKKKHRMDSIPLPKVFRNKEQEVEAALFNDETKNQQCDYCKKVGCVDLYDVERLWENMVESEDVLDRVYCMNDDDFKCNPGNRLLFIESYFNMMDVVYWPYTGDTVVPDCVHHYARYRFPPVMDYPKFRFLNHSYYKELCSNGNFKPL